MNLHQPLSVLPGIGPKSAEKYKKLGIETVEDLLLYFPFRYEDFKSKNVLDLEDGEKAVVSGLVATPANVQYYGYKRNRLRFTIKQGELVLAVSFFNQPYLADKIELGQTVAVFGKWDKAKGALTGMKLLAQVEDDLQPVYRLSQGVSQSALVKVIKTAFEAGLDQLLEENLPQILMDKYHLLSRRQAVRAMHFPKDLEEYKQALRRVKFEELLFFQLQLQVLKEENRSVGQGIVLDWDEKKLKALQASLPFAMTEAQERSLSEILADMRSPYHMNRLLQGDVGSGKTVVAGLAMYAAVTAGKQAALMVPTEILAEQHLQSLTSLFPSLKILLLTGSLKASERRERLELIQTGQVDLVVGTHALIQEGVHFHDLGLVIIDEQHRFGVAQRRILREKGQNPDVLMMTATPIPRTLAITAFGDMDVSIIDQMPAGRKEIITRWVKHQQQLNLVLDWLVKEIQKGSQAYVISPLIEESEALDLKNAIALEEELIAYFGDRVRIALLHGKMKGEEKEAIMQAFKQGEIDLLVSTTVIEVGVNVPNATVMIIMDADRFGLSQLHQLRGRVGRGDKQSYAVLVANPKTESGKRRMKIMTETTNGFVLAEEDLKLRGSGEIFGTRQSGIPEFQVASLIEDYPILEEARKVAVQVVTTPNWREHSDWHCLSLHLEQKEHLD